MRKPKYDPGEIVKWLQCRNGEYGPTIIGMEVFDLPYSSASSTISKIIFRLMRDGLVERGDKAGTYRAKR